MADDILRYSDLIAPDNSIDDLIQLLDRVQNEYSALSQAARQYATNLQADMRRVNASTRAGRDELTRLTVQADTLDDVIRGLGDGYRLVERELAGMRTETPKATRNIEALTDQVQRYNDIITGLRNMRNIFRGPMAQGLDRDFLRDLKELENVVNEAWPALNEYAASIRETLLELRRVQDALDFDATGRAASDSLTNLEQALNSVIASYKALDAEERGDEIGSVTKSNLEVLRDAVTKLNAEIEPLVDKTVKLIEAQQGLEVAMSDEGKQAVALKQKIAELNKETALQATVVEELSDSRKSLRAQLVLAENEFDKLGKAEQNSEVGIALQDRIKNLKTSIAEVTAKLKPAKAELTALEQAQKALAQVTKALDVALTDEGKQAVALKQTLSELNKETKLQVKEAEAEEGAYDKLKAQLALAIAGWKRMGATERDTTAEGQALTAHIVDLSTQLKGLDNRLKAATESMSQDQIEMAMAADVAEKLAQAKAKVKIATSDEYKELMALSEEQREANRIAELEAVLKTNSIDSYNGMAAQYELNKIKLRKLAIANRELTEDEEKLVAETYTLRNEMKKFQEMTGVHTLSVGEYGKVWDSFGFSIQQIVREMPAAAQGINNLFIAVSNNIPIFVDELMKLRKENAALIAQNRQDEVVSIGKRIAASLVSWQTALMALLTVLTMFGDDILKWVGSLFKGEAAVMSMRKAVRNLNKELENSNDSYGGNMASFKKLQNQWAALTTEAEKAEWIKNHEEAFKDLGEAAETVADVERILVEQADAVEETFRRRAKAAAATTLAAEEYEEALLKTEKAERKKKEQAEAWAKSHNANVDRFYADRFGYDSEYRQSMYLTAEDFLEDQSGRGVHTLLSSGSWRYRSVDDIGSVKRLKAEAAAAEANAEQYLKMGAAYDDLLDASDKKDSDPEGRDLTDRIYQARLQASKKYAESETELIKNEYEKRRAEAKASTDAEIKTLEEANRKAMDWLQDNGDKYKELTDEQRQALEDTIIKNNAAILNLEEKLVEDLRLLAIDQQINQLKIQEETNSLMQQAVKKGSEREYELRKESIERQGQIALKENKKLKGTDNYIDPAKINAAYNQQMIDADNEWAIQQKEIAIAGVELKLQAVREGSAEEMELQKELLAKQLELELEQNKLLADNLKQQEVDIKASYARREKFLKGQYMLEAFQEGQAAERAQYIADNKAGNKGMKSKRLNDYYLGIYDQEQAIALLELQIWQAEQGFLDWSPAQIAEAKANLVTLNRELDKTKNIWNLMGEKGVGGGILTKLGFKDDQIDAFMNATNIIISQIQAIAQAEVDAAQKAVEAAQERVDAFQSAYDAEIEARNNGYANSVATAKAELEQEKKKQEEKQKLLEVAQRNQARIDSAMQTSSLVTATANLWASYSKLGPLGQALTIAAIAAMWGSFGAAKIKAKNVTSQEYGEGGLEFLEGGSHASGNDIDLGAVNSRGRRMRAEGGEAMAIINKKNTRKYKALLPGIVDSLNAGNFEEKYLSSLNTSGISFSVNSASIDISKIEDDVADIKKQNETKYYTADGYLIVQRKNVKRIIKN